MGLKDGIYDSVINELITEQLNNLDKQKKVNTAKIEQEEANDVLSKYMSIVISNSIRQINKTDRLTKSVDLCNKIIDLIENETSVEDTSEYKIDKDSSILLSVLDNLETVKRPVTTISGSSLFTGASNEPSLESELNKEISSSEKIDMLVSFIKWSGMVKIYDALKDFTNKGHKLRIITTSYMGATDYKAIEELSKLPNTEIKISYDTNRTRLHSKSYMFYRPTGFSTAYVGSSNLSSPALTSGLEWNLKISEYTSREVLEKFKATFEIYWNDNEFYTFDSSKAEDKDRLRCALNSNKEGNEDNNQYFFDIIPYDYQRGILEKLSAERQIHNRYRNLIVAATGTGKTVISAFDYKRFRKENPDKRNRLLFIAHREEILNQSLFCYRNILRDNNFGELCTGNFTPTKYDFVFMTIQTYNSRRMWEMVKPDYYDYVVVDETHHSAAASYDRLLEYVKPRILLGMTATPERMDGKDILKYYCGKIAAEIRLGEAINRKLLCPFNYFGVTDDTSLEHVKFVRGGYDIDQLTCVYTKNNQRVKLIIEKIKLYACDLSDIKCIGFCVSKTHAEFMSNEFNKYGLPSVYLTDQTEKLVRRNIKNKLESGEIKFIFVVDLYNEGVDIPDINTVLFLRPTESITVFLQQLGRGLRLAEGKDCLTVLDFVGQANKSYTFYEAKFRNLIGKTNNSVDKEIENEFPNMPKGCFIKLEKIASKYILENIRANLNNKTVILRKLRDYVACRTEYDVVEFSNEYSINMFDLYDKASFTQLLMDIGAIKPIDEKYKKIYTGIRRLLHIDSIDYINCVLQILESDSLNISKMTAKQRLILNMFYYNIYQFTLDKVGFDSIEQAILLIKENETILKEIKSVLRYNIANVGFVGKSINLGYECPLELHCQYSRDEVLSALEYYKINEKPIVQAGVQYIKDKKTDIFFVTLNKTEKQYSESTMYEDYAINDIIFHWQSQNATSPESPTGQRYINHVRTGNTILLFVRESKLTPGSKSITSPYYFLGPVTYIEHEGSKPMSIKWKLKYSMPQFIESKATGA